MLEAALLWLRAHVRDAAGVAFGAWGLYGFLFQRPRAAAARELTPEELFEVTQLAREGRRIAAMRRYRQLSAAGLKEARDFVDALSGQPGSS